MISREPHKLQVLNLDCLAQAVLLGDELSQVAMLGWNAEPVKNVIKKIAKYRNISFKDALEEVKQMADMAQDLAVHYGASKVRHLIPNSETTSDPHKSSSVVVPLRSEKSRVRETSQPQANMAASAESNGADAAGEEGLEDLIEMALTGTRQPEPQPVLDRDDTETKLQVGVQDVHLQMNIMQQLNKLIADKKVDVNQMLSLVMGGMCDALGLERVVMSLVSKDSTLAICSTNDRARSFRFRFFL